MTTVAYFQYTNISNSYVSAPQNGPLNSSRTPLAMQNHNKGILSGMHPNPQQFYPSDGASEFSNARRQYLRTNTTQNNFSRGTQMYSTIPPTSQFISGLQKSYQVSQSTKYIPPASSSLYISAKKSSAVGRSSMPTNIPLTYKNYNVNDVKTALRFVRSGGSVAPAKKGSIYNTSTSNAPVRWGSIVRQTY